MAINVRSLLSLAGRVVRIARSVSSSTSSTGSAPPRRRRRTGTTSAAPPRPSPSPHSSGSSGPSGPSRSGGRGASGISLAYSPSPDGRPDPGEIVWTWVAYEDDPAQGKDRPVLLIARDEEDLLGLMLTSRDHTNSRDRDSRYVDIGTGAWDRQGRPSEVRVDRLLTVDPSSVRREGAVLSRDRFEQVVEALPSGLLDRHRG